MAVSIPFRIDSMTVNSASWNPIIAVVTADNFVINNIVGTDDLQFSHDPAGAIFTTIYRGNSWTLPQKAGYWSRVSGMIGIPRFKVGDTIGYIKSTVSSPRQVEVVYAV